MTLLRSFPHQVSLSGASDVVVFLIIPEPLLCFQLSIYRSLYIQSKQSNLFQRSVKEITSSPLSCGRNPLKSPKQQRAKGFKRVDTHHRALKYSPPRSPRAHSHCYKLAHACKFVEKKKKEKKRQLDLNELIKKKRRKKDKSPLK